MRNRSPNRRQVLGSLAGAAASTFAVPAILHGRNLNEKLNIAIIGAGGRGRANTAAVASENIVALCDVYEPNLHRAAERFPKARKEIDFRRLYDHHKEFDAVVVSTCEHTHAFATLPALQLGKHVYCEKPLTHNIYEARVVTEAAQRAGVATQMGTQIHATENYRRVVELIRAGAIGAVREVHVWVSRAWGWHPSPEAARAAGDFYVPWDRPPEGQLVPSGLHWDLWLGPAPERPFHEVYWPGPKWYRWWVFGNGTMSDLGSHWIDLPVWALELGPPETVEASGPPPHPELAPASMRATYHFPARGDHPPVTLTWYQGTEKPELWLQKQIPQWPNGHLFIGTEGMLLSDYGRHQLLPAEKFADYQGPEKTLPRVRSHHQEWLDACKGGPPSLSHFGYAGPLTEICHLGNVAFRTGKKLHWDSANLRAANAPEADAFIRRQYRKGWSLE